MGLRRANRGWLAAAAAVGCWGATLTAAQAQRIDPWGVLAPERPAQALPGDAAPWSGDCATGPAPAELADRPLTLAEAAMAALCANPQARQAWAQAQAQSAQVGQATAAFFPTLNGALSSTKDAMDTRSGNSRSRNVFNVHGKNLTLSWTLFDFGGRSANLTQAEQNLAAAMASHDATLQSVLVATAQAYHEAAATAASVKAAAQAEASARESLGAASTRRQLGAATVIDELQARTVLSQATLARLRAEGNERISRGALARLIGADPQRPPAVQPDPLLDRSGAVAEPGAAELSRDIGALLAEAGASHPSLLAARAQVAAAEARLAASQSELYPNVSVTMGYYLNGRPGTAFSDLQTRERLATVTLAIPLFDGFGRFYRVKEQQAQLGARREELAAAQAQVAFDVWRQHQALQVEAASVDAVQDLVRSAGEAREGMAARYRAGAADIVDLLNAQKDEANAQQERIQAVANWRTARLRLLGSLGRLGLWAFGR